MKFGSKNSQVTDVEVVGNEVRQASPTAVSTDDRRYARIGWLIVLLGVGGFLLWAGLAPLDKGVPAQGTVMVSGNRKAVQDMVGGIVDNVLVRNGDTVQAGQVLVRMNAVQARSQAEMLRTRYHSLKAVEARLIAQRDQTPGITFGPELNAVKGDVNVASVLQLQEQLFHTQRAALQSELNAIDQNIAGLRAQIQGLQATQESRKQQAGFLKEQLTGMRDLAKDGYVARNRLLELERSASQVTGDLAEATAGIIRAQRQISELEQRKAQRQQEFQREVRTQLTDTSREAEATGSQLQYAEFQLANTEVRAPVSGIVMGLNVFTDGGVVASGARLMDIVPEGEPLMVEVRVPVHLIDTVHPGLQVEMMFTAFNQRTTPHVPGTVHTVSADRYTDDKTGEPYYRMEAQVLPEGEKLLSMHQIRPGMPVEVLVKTGERSMLNYLFRPILDRASTALVQE